MTEQKERLELCQVCPFCKNEMDILYSDFWTIPFINPYPVIRGQVCNTQKCTGYGIERRHPNNGETMTKEQYNLFKISRKGNRND